MAKKKKDKLKDKLHKLIDSIEDEKTLNILHEEVVPYAIRNKLSEDSDIEDLTGEQQMRLEKAIQQADEGKTISYEELKKRMSEWLSK